jgi:hypothetical protein
MLRYVKYIILLVQKTALPNWQEIQSAFLFHMSANHSSWSELDRRADISMAAQYSCIGEQDVYYRLNAGMAMETVQCVLEAKADYSHNTKAILKPSYFLRPLALPVEKHRAGPH